MALTKTQRRRMVQRGLASTYRAQLLPAEIGKLESDGSYTVFVDQAQNLIYARLTEDNNKVVVAYNLRVKNKQERPIWLRQTTDGYEVEGLRGKRASEFLGEAAPSENTPELIGVLMKTIIPARNYEPGLVRKYDDTSLIVHVEPFWYRYHGAWVRWAGGTIDLADYLPATTDYWQWALVCVWGYGNQLVVVTGTETNNYSALTDGTLDDLSASIEGLIPLDAVKVQEGSTTITHTEYFQHGRLLPAETGLSSLPDSITTAYFHLPAGRTVLWPDAVTISGGTFTLEGTVVIK